jgi:hypothetical protein
MIYRLIGKAVVTLGLRYVRKRYSRQLRIGLGLAVAGLGAAAYLASRNVPEG